MLAGMPERGSRTIMISIETAEAVQGSSGLCLAKIPSGYKSEAVGLTWRPSHPRALVACLPAGSLSFRHAKNASKFIAVVDFVAVKAPKSHKDQQGSALSQ